MEALIRRRRAQLIVHSYLYYWMGTSLVDDTTFDKWSLELVDLQSKHPEPIGFYDEVFKDWNGNTGMHLPRDPWVISMAVRLQRYHYEVRDEHL